MKYQSDSIDAEIVQLAVEGEQCVFFTPPYYSDLQPIDLLCKKAKSGVAKLYDKHTLLDDVRNRVVAEFEALDTDHFIIDRTDLVIQKFISQIEREVYITEQSTNKRDLTEKELSFHSLRTVPDFSTL